MPTTIAKNVFINRTTPSEKHYFKINQDIYFLASSRLNKSGMTVYMYLMSLVPSSWDFKPNKDNNRRAPFSLMTNYAAQATFTDVKTIQRGINNLIEVGYLIERKDNLYQFIDILPEDKIPNDTDNEKINNYEEDFAFSLQQLNEENENHLKNIAEMRAKSNEKIKLSKPEQYSWETDEEYQKRIH